MKITIKQETFGHLHKKKSPQSIIYFLKETIDSYVKTKNLCA